MKDRIGVSFRKPWAAELFANASELDVLEVMADDYLFASPAEQSSLQVLQSLLPLSLHGVGLGLASVHAPPQKRVDAWKQLLDRVQPDSWSEHLAWVRNGTTELGHLAAPPWTQATLDGLVRNVHLLGHSTKPLLENIATLYQPPFSTLTEPNWVSACLEGTRCDWLLDLHNLYANALNFGLDPMGYLQQFPLARVKQIHLAGGRWLQNGRYLDDHRHAIPEAVFAMLELLATQLPQALTVVVERDAPLPHFSVVLEEVRKARACVKNGRDRQKAKAA